MLCLMTLFHENKNDSDINKSSDKCLFLGGKIMSARSEDFYAETMFKQHMNLSIKHRFKQAYA